MVDERFSALAFASAGIDSQEARVLADLLAEEVAREMQDIVETHFTAIIQRLNAIGHELKPEMLSLGEIAFRDDYEDDHGYHCKLRVAFDLVVSTGYAHLSSNSEGT